MTNNLCKLALQANGTIQPLFFNSTESGHTGLTNPSILIDGKDFYINLRNVQYALYHSEYGQNFQNHWGCLAYLNPEDDITLRTRNYLSKNNSEFKFGLKEINEVIEIVIEKRNFIIQLFIYY